LLAHEVGDGEIYDMVVAAMDMQRLKLCNKSLFVVPNHLTEQTASEFWWCLKLIEITTEVG
jgi:N12 class adenine-specific DNA methylase